MNIEFYYLLLTAITVIIVLFFGLSVYKHIKRLSCVKNFADYIAVLEYHFNKAYEMVHKDQILVYSLEGSRVKEEEIDTVSQNFARLVIKLIGPVLYKEFVNLYGNDETFMFIILEYFNTRYEGDEIRKQAIDEISSKEEEG
jgi:hypothetical protein